MKLSYYASESKSCRIFYTKSNSLHVFSILSLKLLRKTKTWIRDCDLCFFFLSPREMSSFYLFVTWFIYAQAHRLRLYNVWVWKKNSMQSIEEPLNSCHSHSHSQCQTIEEILHLQFYLSGFLCRFFLPFDQNTICWRYHTCDNGKWIKEFWVVSNGSFFYEKRSDKIALSKNTFYSFSISKKSKNVILKINFWLYI